MIALDTNILVRYLTQDDIDQAAIASRLIEDELSPARPGFISLIVIVELGWVLGRLYGCGPAKIADIVAQLMAVPSIVLENPSAVAAALASKHGDLSDALLHQVGLAQGCERTLTFDRAFARMDGVTLLEA